MKQITAMLAIVAAAVLLGLIIFVALLHSAILHSNPILFYRGLLLAMLDAGVLALLLLLAFRRWRVGDAATLLASVTASLSVNLAFLIVMPVTIDRSVSVFLLSRIEAAPPQAPLDAQGLRDIFIRDYVFGMAQVDRRIDEQIRSGNISVDQGKLRLSAQGAHFMRLARYLATMLGTDPRFVGMKSESTLPLVKDK
jgi:hypothetical protein